MNYKEEINNFLQKQFQLLEDSISWTYNEKNRQIIIICPHEYYKDFLYDNYIKKIKKKLTELYNVTDIILSTKKGYIPKEKFNIKFNQYYTFENFFYSKETDLTIKLIKEIIKENKSNYNPIIIYGEKNSGKTHIIHAIGNHYIKQLKKNEIFFIDFKKSSFLLKLQIKDIEKIKIFMVDHFENYDVKSDKDRIVIKYFKYLIDKNIKIYLAVRNKLNKMIQYDELSSLLSSGIFLHLKLPDFDTRLEFIKKYSNKNNLPINNEKMFELALKCLDIPSIMEQLNYFFNIRKTKKYNVQKILHNKNPQEIIKIVTEWFNITERDLFSRNNKKNISLARHIAIYLCRTILKLSTTNLEKIFKRNHSTILYSIKKINKLKEESVDINNMLEELYKRCRY